MSSTPVATVALYTLMTPKFITLLICYSDALLDVVLGLNVEGLQCGKLHFLNMAATVFPIQCALRIKQFDTPPIKRWRCMTSPI